MKRFYLLCAIVGAVIPWLFFGSFFINNGLNLLGFVQGLFSNGASGGFAADLLLSIGIFWVWSYQDARRLGIARWWLVPLTSSFVGLSLALPLYLYLRADHT